MLHLIQKRITMKTGHFSRSISPLSLILVLIFLVVSGCKISKSSEENTQAVVHQVNVEEDWQSALKTSFRQYYGTVVSSHAEKMHANYPVITQDLLNMTLIPSNGEKVRYSMNKKAYSTFAHTSHTPLSIYLVLSASDFNVDEGTIVKLNDYSLLLKNAIEGIKKVEHIREDQKQRILSLLTESGLYIHKIISNKRTSKEEYQEFADAVMQLIEANLHDGAMEQLTQFREQLENWKVEFPDENWEELRVAVLGFHQPRDLYTAKLFFQWLLKEPAIEKRVVYAEFQFPIFGRNRERAEELALELLTKVEVDKEASLLMLGEETLLQKDVMGPAAEKILVEWGESTWFGSEN